MRPVLGARAGAGLTAGGVARKRSIHSRLTASPWILVGGTTAKSPGTSTPTSSSTRRASAAGRLASCS